jgi:hypothetical protein
MDYARRLNLNKVRVFPGYAACLIWELMITRQWGTVHGVLYADGTVRDPSIVAALPGFFRNRGPEVMLSALRFCGGHLL